MSRAIDADALSEWLKDYGQKVIKGERKISLMYVWKHIQDMQTIEERKNGKWNAYCHGDIDFSYSCNQCGYSAPYQMIGGEVFQKKWNFCPNCGADMRGIKDGCSNIKSKDKI